MSRAICSRLPFSRTAFEKIHTADTQPNDTNQNDIIYIIIEIVEIHLVSISPTFYEQLLHQNPFAKKLQTQIVSTEKLCMKLLYEKAARKILAKLTPSLTFVGSTILFG